MLCNLQNIAKSIRTTGAAIIIGLSTTFPALADEVLNATNGVAMDGFDVVSYFKDNAPTKGSDEHVVTYKGSDWKFSSAENAATFESQPQKYAPQNNGWCSYAVSEGYGAEVDFVNGWSILDDKLYLNYNEATKHDFIAQKDVRIPKAENNWSEVHAGLIDGSVELYLHKDDASADISHPQQLPQ